MVKKINNKNDIKIGFALIYILFLFNIMFLGLFALQITNQFKYLDFEKEFLDIEIIRLYDNNINFDKVPLGYICTENVKVTILDYIINNNRITKSYFSTWHNDGYGIRVEERGLCFIKWEE